MSELGNALCGLAREAVAAKFRGESTADVVAAAKEAAAESERIVLGDPGATFVTLKRNEELRGCIGSLKAVRSLAADAARNALLASTDSRMEPVVPEELGSLSVSVAVLSRPEPWDVEGFVDLCGGLRPGIDGLTLRDGSRQATFLPSVWKSLGDPERFIAALLRKGEWPEEHWAGGRVLGRPWPLALSVERYETTTYEVGPVSLCRCSP